MLPHRLPCLLLLPLLGAPLSLLGAQGAGQVLVTEHYVHPAFAAPGHVPVPGATTPVGARQEAAAVCLDNDAYLGLVYDMATGQELVDWGTKACGASGLVETLTYGIQTTNLRVSSGGPGHTIGVRLFAGATGGAPGELGTLVADYTFHGDYGTPPGGLLATAFLAVTLPTPLVLPDGPLAWSYVWKEAATDPTLVRTAGAPCSGGTADPVTGTFDCLGDWNYPAGEPGGFFFASVRPAAGQSSLFLRLSEAPAVVASASTRTAAPNPDVYTAGRPIVGATWTAAVDTAPSGHALALVFGFDTPTQLTLGGGQVLLALDGGSGELLAQSVRSGPDAAFAIPVPLVGGFVGASLSTQAILFGGVTPFALSNAQDLLIGTE